MLRIAAKLAISVVIIALGAAAVAVGATMIVGTQATDVPGLQSPELSTGSGPIINATNLLPGEIRESQVTVTNPNAQTVDLWISGARTGGSAELYDNLYLSVADESGLPRWSGALWELNARRNTGLFAANESRKLKFNVQLVPWAGNQLQDKTTEFNLNFSFDDDAYRKPGADVTPPVSKLITKRPSRRDRRRNRTWLIKGSAVDTESAIVEVKMSLIRIVRRTARRKRSCLSWSPVRKRMINTGRVGANCRQAWFTVNGKNNWRYRFPLRRLRTGTYIFMTRAIDAQGNVESTFSDARGNRASFRWRQKRKLPPAADRRR